MHSLDPDGISKVRFLDRTRTNCFIIVGLFRFLFALCFTFSYVRFGVARSRRGTCLNLIIEYSRTILVSRLG